MYISILPVALVRKLINKYEDKDIFLIQDNLFNDEKNKLLRKKWIKQDEFLRFIDSTKNSNYTYFRKHSLNLFAIYIMLKQTKINCSSHGIMCDTKFKELFYIKFSSFSYSTLNEIKSEILNCRHDHIIIDLRNNGGGNFDVCTQIIDLFLPKMNYLNLIYKDSSIKTIISNNSHKTFKKIFILLNENSASCSEIFSMVLRKKLPNVFLIGKIKTSKLCTQHVINNRLYGYTFAIADSIWKVDGEGAENLEQYIRNDTGELGTYTCQNDYLKKVYALYVR